MSFKLHTLSTALLLCIPLLSHANESTPIATHNATTPENMTASTVYATAPVSQQQAAGIAQQQVPGRILKVTLEGSVYRVKIVSQSGDVVDVFVDSSTGEILSK